MATNFPTNIDTFTEQTSSDLITSAKWNNLQDSIEALEIKVGADNSTVTTSHDYKIDALETAIDTKPTKRSADITVTVGSGGDYSTINDALAALSAYYPLYVSGGFTAEISLLTGFEMAEQVLVSGIDLSWITITSVDAEVTITRSALTTAFEGRYPVFGARRGKLPVISALFNMDTSGTGTDRDGIYVTDGAGASISSGCGVKNAGGTGLNVASAGYANASRSNFSGSDICLGCAAAGRVYANGATLTGATTRGVYVIGGGMANIVSANCQKGGSPAASDIVVATGGIVFAGSATGGLSQTANTVTAAGIIFQ